MIDIRELLSEFNNLNVNLSNIDLYRKLLDLDYSVYKPIILRILDKTLDIEDTRPIFNNVFRKDTTSNKLFILNSEAAIKRNFSNRVFGVDKDNYIKEVDLNVVDISSIKENIKTAYFNNTGKTLTDNQLDVMIIAYTTSKHVDISLDSFNNDKSQQIAVSNALST
jgi:hypothetical protein